MVHLLLPTIKHRKEKNNNSVNIVSQKKLFNVQNAYNKLNKNNKLCLIQQSTVCLSILAHLRQFHLAHLPIESWVGFVMSQYQISDRHYPWSRRLLKLVNMGISSFKKIFCSPTLPKMTQNHIKVSCSSAQVVRRNSKVCICRTVYFRKGAESSTNNEVGRCEGFFQVLRRDI